MIGAAVLEFILPGDGSARYVALLSAEPSIAAGTYTEIDVDGYSRLETTGPWVDIAVGGGVLARVNNGALLFAEVNAPVTVTHWAIFDAVVAGNLLAAGPLLDADLVPHPQSLEGHDQLRFNDGTLQVRSEAP